MGFNEQLIKEINFAGKHKGTGPVTNNLTPSPSNGSVME